MSEPSDPPAAAASGAAAGHGRIRLRGQLPRLDEAPAMTAPDPGPAAVAGPVGHGTIRLLGRAHGASDATTHPDPAAAADPVGHGEVVLYGHTPEAQPRFATLEEPDDTATVNAREDILAALVATT